MNELWQSEQESIEKMVESEFSKKNEWIKFLSFGEYIVALTVMVSIKARDRQREWERDWVWES